MHALLLPLLCSTLRTKKQERDLPGGGPPSAPGPREDGLHHRWRRSPSPALTAPASHTFERLESWKLIGQKLRAFFSDSSPGVDDFLLQEAGPGQVLAGVLGVFVCVCVVVGAAARYVAPGRRTDTSESLTGASSGPALDHSHAHVIGGGAQVRAGAALKLRLLLPSVSEYGHTAVLETGGASEDTAKAHGLRVRGQRSSSPRLPFRMSQQPRPPQQPRPHQAVDLSRRPVRTVNM